jgi:hypothetical protein
LAVAHYGGKQTQYGGDAFTRIPLVGPLALEVALGVRAALATTSAHGTISAKALTGDLGLRWAWFRRGDFLLDAELSAELGAIAYRASATPGATAQTAQGFAGTGRLGLGAVFAVSRTFRSFSTLGAGYPWLAYSATDSGRAVSGVSGIEVYATSGLAVEF